MQLLSGHAVNQERLSASTHTHTHTNTEVNARVYVCVLWVMRCVLLPIHDFIIFFVLWFSTDSEGVSSLNGLRMSSEIFSVCLFVLYFRPRGGRWVINDLETEIDGGFVFTWSVIDGIQVVFYIWFLVWWTGPVGIPISTCIRGRGFDFQECRTRANA